MEQMCTGVYYFLGPVFVMAKWECSLYPLTPLLILLPAALLGPPGTVHALGFGLVCSRPLSPSSPCSSPI